MKNGEELFIDLTAASARLQNAHAILIDTGERETAQLVYRANCQVVEAIAKLVRAFSIKQDKERLS